MLLVLSFIAIGRSCESIDNSDNCRCFQRSLYSLHYRYHRNSRRGISIISILLKIAIITLGTLDDSINSIKNLHSELSVRVSIASITFVENSYSIQSSRKLMELSPTL